MLSGQQVLAETNKNIQSVCQVLSVKIENFSTKQCQQINFQNSNYYSVKQYPLIQKELLPKTALPIAKIMLLGGIHADEKPSIDLTLKWIIRLQKISGNNYHWLTLPIINIDSLTLKKPLRVNANGVDLNRNFPSSINRGLKPYEYWLNDGQKSRYYPGLKPLNQPESQAIINIVEKFKPNLIISMHTPYGLIDYDGPPEKAPQSLGNLPLKLLPSYPGSLGNYLWNFKRIPVLTIELAQSFEAIGSEDDLKIWNDTIEWLDVTFQQSNHKMSQNEIFNQGLTAFSLDNYNKATELFSQITKAELYTAAQNNLALSQYHLGNYDDAKKIWQTIKNNHSEIAVALQNLKQIEHTTKSQKPHELDLRLTPLPPAIEQQELAINNIKQRLNSWKRSWLSGDTKSYFKHYVNNTSPRQGKNYKKWREERENQLVKRQLFSLELENLEITLDQQKNEAKTTFTQKFHLKYRNKTNGIVKQLVWQKNKNQWFIRHEKILKL